MEINDIKAEFQLPEMHKMMFTAKGNNCYQCVAPAGNKYMYIKDLMLFYIIPI